MLDTFREDLRRYGRTPRQQARALLLTPGLWATGGYRFARWVHSGRAPRPLRKVMSVISTFISLAVDVLTNIELPPTADIGPGLFIPHTGYIVLGGGVTLGRHCTLAQGVTIGHAGGGNETAAAFPMIGDRVYVGPGAAVIGPINIGHDALIGVSAVVIKSVPACGIAVGNPARVISLKGSFEMVRYDGMEIDPERQSALDHVRQLQSIEVS